MILKLLILCFFIASFDAHPTRVEIVVEDIEKYQYVSDNLEAIKVSAEWGKPEHSRFVKLEDSKSKASQGNADKARTCGYDSCPNLDPTKLNVHLVAHSHDDVGWLKTVDQYYYGSKTRIQRAGIQYIIDSVVQALLRDPTKKFIYVEAAYFHKWWHEQTPELQDQVRMLVNEGRLEIIGGAWSMNDEAAVHYQSVIDQFSYGLKFWNDTFGECGRPKIGWQIDPFGHTREQASMFAQMGYDGLFFGRLDYQDKDNRLKTKTQEMIWHGSENLGEQADLFTGVLYNGYSPPSGFCFDILCADEPIIDDPKSPDYNVNRRAAEFIEYAKNVSKGYRTNNILQTMGEDFHYQDAHMWYKNLDKLIKYINSRKDANINIFYSTPSCYLKSLHDADTTWPEKSNDFFPYASDIHSFWTGYFTSRPTLKRFERLGNHFLQVCKQLSAVAKDHSKSFEAHLNSLREVMGIMQHHDAVTGTEKQHVADDYARLLHKAFVACGSNTKVALQQLVAPESSKKQNHHVHRFEEEPKKIFDFESCLNLNISECSICSESDQFIVTVYNPLAYTKHEYVRLPISGPEYSVKDHKGLDIPYQIVPIAQPVLDLKYRISESSEELVFLATDIPAVGYKQYLVTKIPANDPEILMADQPEPENEFSIGTDQFKVIFGVNGLISGIFVDGELHDFKQEFYYYEGNDGDNYEPKNRSSGAYIFRPKVNTTEKLVADEVRYSLYEGDLVDEVHQVFNDWISQVVRVYKKEMYVEFEWMVGPIPVEDKIGKEIITRYTSSINNDGVFYTDSNGRETMKRVRNERDTWKIDLIEKVAGNYYPINTKIAIEDNVNRFSVLVDRAQGGGSLEDGAIELMVHRRLLHDDAFGVGEALNETAFGQGLVARGKHWVVIGKVNKESPTLIAQERFLQTNVLVPSWLFFSDAFGMKFDEWANDYNNIYSAISLSLPKNVYLMTIEPWREDSILVRFEHTFEKNEDPEWSKPAHFNFENVFRQFDITSIREVTLSANQWIEDAKRFKFQADPELPGQTENLSSQERFIKLATETNKKLALDYEVTLNPMQIRTFIVTLNS